MGRVSGLGFGRCTWAASSAHSCSAFCLRLSSCFSRSISERTHCSSAAFSLLMSRLVCLPPNCGPRASPGGGASGGIRIRRQAAPTQPHAMGRQPQAITRRQSEGSEFPRWVVTRSSGGVSILFAACAHCFIGLSHCSLGSPRAEHLTGQAAPLEILGCGVEVELAPHLEEPPHASAPVSETPPTPPTPAVRRQSAPQHGFLGGQASWVGGWCAGVVGVVPTRRRSVAVCPRWSAAPCHRETPSHSTAITQPSPTPSQPSTL